MIGPIRTVSRRSVLAGLATTGFAVAAKPAEPADADAEEPALEPDLPIIDPHHHVIDRAAPAHDGERRYLMPDFYRDVIRSGHRVTKTMFVECGTMYRSDGPPELRSLGETEYVRQVADESALAHPGSFAAAAGMIAKVDLSVGAKASDLLVRHVETSGGRLRGVRNSIAWDAYPPLAGMGLNRALLSEPQFIEGFRALAPLGLSFDVWMFHPQIPELTSLARRFPDTAIVLNHCGHPLEIGPYVGHESEVRAAWKASMQELAKCPNVKVKIGGLGPLGPVPGQSLAAHGSVALAEQWRFYVDTTIDLFETRRCMFESNYPANAGTATYGATWNTFKRITSSMSHSEKSWLYERTARDTYRL